MSTNLDDMIEHPQYRGIMQDMAPAFERSGEYTLTSVEVMVVYLALIRLRDIEAMAAKKDWKGIAEYCPEEDVE